MLMLLAQASDPLSGGAGWVGAGLLGLCLAWLFLKHLPAKDEQIKTMLEMGTIERDKEAKARHDMRDTFQKVVTDIELEHRKDMITMMDQHRSDADKDRVSFERRHDMMVAAIHQQTTELKLAIIAGSCKLKPEDMLCPMMVDQHQNDRRGPKPT